MLIRNPVAAGRFYPDNAKTLLDEVQYWLTQGAALHSPSQDTISEPSLRGVMLPHAGYVFCGSVIGRTLALAWGTPSQTAPVPRHIIFLCPNHTGKGHPLGIWPEGYWRTPLGDVPVDATLADALITKQIGFAADTGSHLYEHSIEVLLPFFQFLSHREPWYITPVCIGTHTPSVLRTAGLALADVMQRYEDIALIVSSDMNHYEDQETTLHKDARALAPVLSCDAEGLLNITQREHITMCGAAPMALALFAAKAAGRPWAKLDTHDTSAAASGDALHVVGYAGVRFGWNNEGAPNDNPHK